MTEPLFKTPEAQELYELSKKHGLTGKALAALVKVAFIEGYNSIPQPQ